MSLFEAGQERERERLAQEQRRAAEDEDRRRPSSPAWLGEFLSVLAESGAPQTRIWDLGVEIEGRGRRIVTRPTVRATGWVVRISGYADNSPDPPASFSDAFLFCAAGVWRVDGLGQYAQREKGYRQTWIRQGAPSSFLAGELFGGAPTEGRAADAVLLIKRGKQHVGDDGVIDVHVGMSEL